MDDPLAEATRIIAVVVTYQPELSALACLLDAVLPQVEAVVVVDNGSETDVAAWLAGRGAAAVHGINLGENRGIAVAQNIGIAWAGKEGAEYVLLFDQDSEPAPDMVARLLAAAKKLIAAGHRVAAVGPRHGDPRRDRPWPFIRLQGLRLKRCACEQPQAVIPAGHLISSGSLIPMRTLAAVGGMTESLFIDYVDIEWCLRAQHQGYQSFGVCDAVMTHALGEEPVRFLGRTFSMHSPLRYYYQFRNAVWLCRRPWLSVGWKYTFGWRLLYKYGVYGLIGRPRLASLRMMTKGFWHGMRGYSGRCPEKREQMYF